MNPPVSIDNQSSALVIVFIYGEPASPTSESLAIIELSSQSSGEGKSDSGSQESEDDVDIRKGDLPEVGSGKSTESSSMAVLTAREVLVGNSHIR